MHWVAKYQVGDVVRGKSTLRLMVALGNYRYSVIRAGQRQLADLAIHELGYITIFGDSSAELYTGKLTDEEEALVMKAILLSGDNNE